MKAIDSFSVFLSGILTLLILALGSKIFWPSWVLGVALIILAPILVVSFCRNAHK